MSAGLPLAADTWTTMPGTDSLVGGGMIWRFSPYVLSSGTTWTGTDFVSFGYSMTTHTFVTGFRNLANPAWTESTTSPGTVPSIMYASMIWGSGKGLVWGLSGSLASVASVYNSSTDSWSTATTTSNVGPSTPMVWTGSVALGWGGGALGAGGNGSRYNFGSNTWSATNASGAPSSRRGHTLVWTGSEAIVWGGAPSSGAYLNTGGRYNPTGNSWGTAPTTSGAPSARANHAAVMGGTKMYVWGGATDNAPTLTNTGGIYDTVNNTWATMSTTGAPSAREWPAAVWTGTQLVIYGGWAADGTMVSGGAVYTPGTNSWTTIASSPVGNASATKAAEAPPCEMAWSGSRVLVFCVGSFDSALYDPATNTWEGSDVLTATAGASMVWTGSKLLRWGGVDMATYMGALPKTTGALYDPTTQLWSPIADSAGVVSGRFKPSFVWTGTKAIAWGGYDVFNSTVLNDGGMYDPATDTWIATSMTNAPPGALYVTAAWTGSRMVVWGGQDAGGVALNTGGRFDPASNTWQAITTSGAPTARYGHSWAWVNSKMVVWGGHDGSTPVATGKLYDPATDVWSNMVGSSPPTARSAHSTVSTGTKLIVWGGEDSSGNILANGKVWDSATSSWSAMSTTGAPAARHGHIAVWTGSKMIVYGGLDENGNPLNNGGVYDPAANTWSPMTTVNAPASPRSDYAWTWTGSQLAIWGGTDNSTVIYGTGGLYAP